MKKTKILFIHHATGWGGAPQSMLNTIKALDKSKYSAEVLLIRDSIVSKMLRENGVTVKVAKSRFYKSFYTYYYFSRAKVFKWYRIDKEIIAVISWFLNRFFFAGKEISRHEFDIVHLNSSVMTDWLAPCKAKGKTVIHIREPFYRGNLGVRHYLLTSQMRKHADHIIAISNHNAKHICLPNKTSIVYNYSPLPDDPPKNDSYASKNVLYLGGSQYIKGFYTLANALDYLDEDVRVYVAGNIYSKTKHKSVIIELIKFITFYKKKRDHLINKVLNNPNVVIVGLTHNVSELLNKACCLIAPFSVPHFARPVIEAYLHKKAVIASNVYGMDEIVEHKKTGLLFTKNCPQELAKLINELTKNSKLAKTLGEQGYNVALQKYTQDNAKKIELIYESILRNNKQAL